MVLIRRWTSSLTNTRNGGWCIKIPALSTTLDLIFYGGAIRNNQNDLDGMERAIRAIFYHSVSTDECALHHFCPEGADSWCKYHKAMAQSLPHPPHNLKICAVLSEHVKSIFCRLSNSELLEKCLLGSTQNQKVLIVLSGISVPRLNVALLIQSTQLSILL